MSTLTDEVIMNSIQIIRGQKVMLDRDLAELYGVETKALKQRLREMIMMHKDILIKLEQLEQKVTAHDDDLRMVFDALRELLQPPKEPRPRIGFKHYD